MNAKASASHLAFSQLRQKVDSFFDRAFSQLSQQMKCGEGCASCCHTHPTVTGIEADVIWRGLQQAQANWQNSADHSSDRCFALDDNNRCTIYEVRPLICRSHGLAVLQTSPDRKQLPVITSCELNFDGAPEKSPRSFMLDQATLSLTVAAIDKLWTQETGAPLGQRYEVAALLQLAQSTTGPDAADVAWWLLLSPGSD